MSENMKNTIMDMQERFSSRKFFTVFAIIILTSVLLQFGFFGETGADVWKNVMIWAGNAYLIINMSEVFVIPADSFRKNKHAFSKLLSRKMMMFITIVVFGTYFLILTKITPAVWQEVVLFVTGGYLVSNTGKELFGDYIKKKADKEVAQ